MFSSGKASPVWTSIISTGSGPSQAEPVPYSTFDVDVLTVTELSGFVVESHLCDPAYDDPVFVAQLVTLIAESVPWLDVQPFYLGVVSVFQNEETSPGSVTTVFAGHH